MREVEGINEAIRMKYAKSGLIVTMNQTDNVEGIEVIYLEKFLSLS